MVAQSETALAKATAELLKVTLQMRSAGNDHLKLAKTSEELAKAQAKVHDDDDIFIPYRSFKENVAEALLEANQKFWNSANESTTVCPPCDTLACADHLTDE